MSSSTSSSRRFDETNFTTTLATAIDKYIWKLGQDVRVATPGTRYQGTRNLDQADPWDLLAKIGEFGLLILEIKIADQKKNAFESFNLQQLLFNTAMRDAGIPLWYCYNLSTQYEGLEPEDTLNRSNTAEPKLVCDEDGVLTNVDSHVLLKRRIDDLLKDDPNDQNPPGGNGTALAGFFSKEAIDQIYSLNARFVFLLCHTKTQEIIAFSREGLKAFVEQIESQFTIQGVDFKHATLPQMTDHFRNKIQELTTVLIPKAINIVSQRMVEAQEVEKAIEVQRLQAEMQERFRLNEAEEAQRQRIKAQARVPEPVYAR